MSEHTDVVVIGAGQAGLAIGYYLAQQDLSFVILDRAAQVGQSWRKRYDSLTLFTPADYNSLPGLSFPKAVDRYPVKDEVAAYLDRYATTFNLPVHLNTPVQAVRHEAESYHVRTGTATYTADQVVIATGPFQRPFVPPYATNLASDVVQLHSSQYRNPRQIPDETVLVVGGGNSGVQIAEELSRSHTVYLSLGRRQPHLPQRVLGRDLFWWLHRLGIMNVTIDSRLGKRLRQQDPLIGTQLAQHVRNRQIKLLGRTIGVQDRCIFFGNGQSLDVGAVIWATGFRPDYGWIDIPVFDDTGAPVHQRGITAAPGLYFLGLPWMYRRGSALLGGVGDDAAFLATQITARVSTKGMVPSTVGT